ncbi:MAG: hypothetical protein QOE70_5441 [Chthoniobacter sp.]|jgi:hypothetical protein|nr:hypothetical protein [Chthoniobacter sp.]
MNSPQPRPNEDDDIDPAEVEAAADETPTDVTPLELDPQTENLIVWDEAPTSAGTAAPRVLPEDETPIAEQLVYEGTDQADRDRRLAAADPDFEP